MRMRSKPIRDVTSFIPIRLVTSSVFLMLAGLIATKIVGNTSGYEGLLAYSSALNTVGIALAICSLGSETGLIRLYHDENSPVDIEVWEVLNVGVAGCFLWYVFFNVASFFSPLEYDLTISPLLLGVCGGAYLFVRVILLAKDRGHIALVSQGCVMLLAGVLTLLEKPTNVDGYIRVLTHSYSFVCLPIAAYIAATNIRLSGFSGSAQFLNFLLQRVIRNARKLLPALSGFSMVTLLSMVTFQLSELVMRLLVTSSGFDKVFANAEAYVRVNSLWLGFIATLVSVFFIPRFSRTLSSSESSEGTKLLTGMIAAITFLAIAYLPVSYIIFLYVYSGIFNPELFHWLLFSFVFFLRAIGSVLSASNFLKRHFYVVSIGEITLYLLPILILAVIVNITEIFVPSYLALSLCVGVLSQIGILIYGLTTKPPKAIN